MKGEKVWPDGMHENHTIVMTSAPAAKKEGRTKKGRRRFSREDEDGADAGIALDAGGGGDSNVILQNAHYDATGAGTSDSRSDGYNSQVEAALGDHQVEEGR